MQDDKLGHRWNDDEQIPTCVHCAIPATNNLIQYPCAVVEAVKRHSIIDAIKAYRAGHNATFKAAHDYVVQHWDELRVPKSRA